MQVYALTSSHVPSETLDLFVTEEAAAAELREILEDEPELGGLPARRADRTRRTNFSAN